jgi:hypothetical protein
MFLAYLVAVCLALPLPPEIHLSFVHAKGKSGKKICKYRRYMMRAINFSWKKPSLLDVG